MRFPFVRLRFDLPKSPSYEDIIYWIFDDNFDDLSIAESFSLLLWLFVRGLDTYGNLNMF